MFCSSYVIPNKVRLVCDLIVDFTERFRRNFAIYLTTSKMQLDKNYILSSLLLTIMMI